MPNPTINQAVVSLPLTNFSIAYVQRMRGTPFTWANELVPRLPVQGPKVTYPVFSKADFNRVDMQVRAPGTEAQKGGFGLSWTDVVLKAKALKVAQNREVVAAFPSPLDADRAATRYLTQQSYLYREAAIASQFFTTSIWSAQADQTGVASGPSTNQFIQFDASGADPIGTINQACLAVYTACGFWPNRMAMGPATWRILVNHADVVARRNTAQVSGLTELHSQIASIFGLPVDGFRVLGASKNTANRGQSASMAAIMGKGIWIGYVATGEDNQIESVSAFKNLVWQEFDGLGANAEGGAVISRIERPELRGYDLETEQYDAQVVSAADAGCWLASAVS